MQEMNNGTENVKNEPVDFLNEQQNDAPDNSNEIFEEHQDAPESEHLDGGQNESDDDKDGEPMPDYLKKHFRRQEKILKRENRSVNLRLQAAEDELNQYRQLYAATYSQAQQNVPVEQSPSDDVETKVLQTLSKFQQQEQSVAAARAQQRLHQEFQDNLNKTADKYDDFEDVVYANNNPINQTIAQTAQYLPNAGDVLYALSKNKQELTRINRLSPMEQIKAVASFAINLASGNVPKVSQAPKPVSGQMRSSPTTRSLGSEGMSIKELKTHLKNKTRR